MIEADPNDDLLAHQLQATISDEPIDLESIIASKFSEDFHSCMVQIC